jgi:polysaccharide deacetylase family protein (PEP-CTERM system associated)
MICSNVLSVDVEDYFHVEAFSDIVDRTAWGTYPSRVEANTDRLLELFDRCGIKGTFFVLGWVADKHPAIVKKIALAGHELGCHSYWHRLIYRLTPAEFREDTRQAKECIEQSAGQPVYGYRAPSFSITARSRWAPEVLAELGFHYDSSIFPVRHDTYGVPDAPRAPFLIPTPNGKILECPLSTFRVGPWPNLPVGGGGYLRMLPSWYTSLGVRQIRKEALPLVCYVHPWELDPEQPRLNGSYKSRLRHYTNLSKTAERLTRLVERGGFGPFRDTVLLARVTEEWSL